MTVSVLQGDSREVLQLLADDSIDSVLTDPPYALVSISKRFGKTSPEDDTKTSADVRERRTQYNRVAKGFMGKSWDTGETAFAESFWAEVYRVLKPGGHMLVFGGTRTYHRLVCAIEDAGFEIRDQVAWVYGTGFPKSYNVGQSLEKKLTTGKARRPDRDLGGLSRDRYSGSEEGKLFSDTGGQIPLTHPESQQWAGWGTALKPALEPICVARKPLIGTVAENVLEFGTGAINIDACRVSADGPSPTVKRRESARNNNWDATSGIKAAESNDEGKIHRRGRPEAFGEEHPSDALGRFPANFIHDGSDEVLALFPDSKGQLATSRSDATPKTNAIYGKMQHDPVPHEPRGDSGSAARFFYCAKASKGDRHGSKHPTVKPIALLRYLARLITPPGGTILDPFAGSGTTGEAAHLEGFNAMLIEREDEYCADIERRIADLEKQAA